MSDPRWTPLFDLYPELNGRMVDFAGWELPAQYPVGIIAEHQRSAIEAPSRCEDLASFTLL